MIGLNAIKSIGKDEEKIENTLVLPGPFELIRYAPGS